MRRVIIESPYAGDVETHTIYARRCVRDSLQRGESPIASHLLYTQPGILDDNVLKEREHGIVAGYSWMEVADAVIFYNDYGVSEGMANALGERYNFLPYNPKLEIEVRSIGVNPT